MKLDEIFVAGRALTPEQYDYLGYQPKGEEPRDFESGDKLGFNSGDLAYRADTKEEYYIDLGSFILNPTYKTFVRLVLFKQ